MSTLSFNHTFDINQPSVPLDSGDILTFKFILNYTSTSSFTASLSAGDLSVSSNAPSIGYNIISGQGLDFYDEAESILPSTPANEIVFVERLGSMYDSGYIFVPNAQSGSVYFSSSLYTNYGDINDPFVSKPYDILILNLEDGTSIEARIKRVYESSNGLLRVILDRDIPLFSKETVTSVLWLTRKEDETSTYLTFTKRSGQTSYGFIIPNNLAPDILKNIDTITKEVKQKLLADQQGSIQS